MNPLARVVFILPKGIVRESKDGASGGERVGAAGEPSTARPVADSLRDYTAHSFVINLSNE